MTSPTTITASRERHAATRRAREPGGRWWWIGGLALLAGTGLRAPAGGATGRHHTRHEDVPVPRPPALLEPGALHVEPERRPGHGQPRVHRLPAPDGPLLRGVPPLGSAHVGGPASLARLHPLRRRDRDPLPLPHPRPAWSRPDRRRAALHALALLLAVCRPDLGHPAALGRTAIHARSHHRRPSARRLAPTGPLRHRGGPGERNQRHLHHLRRRRARPVAALRRRRAARGHLAPCAGHRRAHRVAHPGRQRLVDGRPRDRGGLRGKRPQVHRNRPVDLGHLQRGRHPARARLLVLLRDGPPRPVDQRGSPLHAEHRAVGDLVRRARAGGARRGLRALARTGIFPRHPLRRGRAGRRDHSPTPTRRRWAAG